MVVEEELIPGFVIKKTDTKGADQLKMEKYEQNDQLKSLEGDMKKDLD